ncbi:SDR family oxidoreductase [Spirosoma taeanense]|uniref:SDR family oxidoreductase n=1 Tax=Spirosoma taeanense TaxID=2735870 RepID=A0A6M5YAC6_9BACT|nr:SDR family oxidoreductase [Spirosoma taeanense]QJW90949.1 SDR family oxidoreductase [Spirosoma taeanense]
MADERILITGATGNVGLETLRALMTHPNKSRFEVLAGVRNPALAQAAMKVQPDGFARLDFSNEQLFDAALAGVNRVLLVRPPKLVDIGRYFKPFVEAMQRAGVRQVVFLSVQGVENNPVVPHHKLEKLIVEAGLGFTFLRPGFFMQNLCSAHRDEIRLRNEIFVPAGNGRTSFIDVRDVAAVAALVLSSPTREHLNRGYELTGSEALTYGEVAQILSRVLARPITYRDPSIPQFIWRKWRKEHVPLGFTMVMVALYTASKLGKAVSQTSETEQLLGRRPILLRDFAEDYRAAWQP